MNLSIFPTPLELLGLRHLSLTAAVMNFDVCEVVLQLGDVIGSFLQHALLHVMKMHAGILIHT